MIAIIGCGTLGTRTAKLLAEEELLLIDHDTIQEINLETQKYKQTDLGKHKATILAQELGANHEVAFIDAHNTELLAQAEVIIDCTDNLLTRRVLSKYSRENNKPLIHGAASKERGIVGLFTNPCLECVYKNKISVENCRGSDIQEAVADTIAEEQARLATNPQPTLFLVYPERKESITPGMTCNEQYHHETNDSFYLTYCQQSGCLSAQTKQNKQYKPKVDELEGIEYELLRNGQIRFYTEADLDVLERTARTIYANQN